MKILVFGAGVQGTLYGVRLALSGQDVTFIARAGRIIQLREQGAAIENEFTGHKEIVKASAFEKLTPNIKADICLVCVRREQLDEILPDLQAATRVKCFIFMVNHGNGSEKLYRALGRKRVVLGFPGAAGKMDHGIVRYVEIPEQSTMIEAGSPEITVALRGAGFRVKSVQDMDSWLRRHAVFITAMAGALYHSNVDPKQLASNSNLMRSFILGVREGWAELDHRSFGPAPFGLRMIFSWMPLFFSKAYWSWLLRSPRGELYFGAHTRHARFEMAALAADLRPLIQIGHATNLRYLFSAIAIVSLRRQKE